MEYFDESDPVDSGGGAPATGAGRVGPVRHMERRYNVIDTDGGTGVHIDTGIC